MKPVRDNAQSDLIAAGHADRSEPVGTSCVLDSKSTTTVVQRRKMLQLLQQGPKTTIDLREHGIMMPATRVFELKNDGHDIHSELVTLFDKQGFKHCKCARYHLVEHAAGAGEA